MLNAEYPKKHNIAILAAFDIDLIIILDQAQLEFKPSLMTSRQSHDPREARTSSGRSPDDVGFAHTSWRLCRHDHNKPIKIFY
jgi:hypothetical protein